jgi:4-diphosphocytidyl-2-C-methyl-D-erythritol kinase
VIVFPNCKINLGLHIIGKRPDGYHNLQTVFYPLPLTDILEIIPQHQQDRSSSFPFSISGIDVQGHAGSNLCVRAYKLLKKDFPELPKIRMHLHKVIPAGAGLGGGSSDAAYTLQLLNKMFHLDISRDKLLAYANELGSDCPFFIINKPCYATSRGEILEELNINLEGYQVVIVNPGIHIDTGLAFMNITPTEPEHSIREIILRPIERWKDELCNDFEKPIFHQYPGIVDIKDELYSHGAVYASMSGSGSTVFGIFKKGKEISLSFPTNYFVRKLDGQLQ